jgi:hypothetical protein
MQSVITSIRTARLSNQSGRSAEALVSTRFRRSAFRRFNDLLRGDAEAQIFGNVEELYGLGHRAGLIRRRDGAEISGAGAGRS